MILQRFCDNSFDKFNIRDWNVHKKAIIQIDPSTLDIIKEWEKAQDIEDQIGIKRSNISFCCRNKYLKNGNLRIFGGYHWLFKTDEDIVRSLRKLKTVEEVDNS